jgi:hypothetical protein
LSEEAYIAAKGVYKDFGAFFQEVVSEYGEEMAMELHRRVFDKKGQGFANIILENFGSAPDVEAIASMFKKSNISKGTATEQIVESSNRVIHRNPECPRYFGFKEAGLTNEVIERYCNICEKAMAPHFASVGLKYEISDFSAPDRKCEEILSKL